VTLFRSRPHKRFVRKHGGSLEVAVHTWTRARDEARIVLVGMCHFADRGFYTGVLDLVGTEVERHGAQVQYERVGKSSELELAFLHECERTTILDLRERSRKQVELLTSHSDLVYQSSVIDPVAAGWHRNVDISDVDMVRMLGLVHRLDRVVPDTLDDLSPGVSRFLARVGAWQIRNLSLFTWVPSGGSRDMVFMDWRNLVAVKAMLEHVGGAERGRAVVAPWGAAHLPGMGDLLARNHFELTGARWLRAIDGKRG
jgi:hypothetical protein